MEHRGAPNDPLGCHFDLLLEDGPSCRTWRLPQIPRLDGPAVEAIPITVHRLAWLDHHDAAVSGGRGWAKRIVGGLFSGSLPINCEDRLSVRLQSTDLKGHLEIEHRLCRIRSEPGANP